MTNHQGFVVRPLSRPARADLKDAFRIYLSPTSLLQYKLNAGDRCYLWKDSAQKHNAIVWPAPEKLQGTVVQTSKYLQTTYDLKLGDRVFLAKDERPLEVINTVYLQELTSRHDNGEIDNSLDVCDVSHWEWFLEDPLGLSQSSV